MGGSSCGENARVPHLGAAFPYSLPGRLDDEEGTRDGKREPVGGQEGKAG